MIDEKIERPDFEERAAVLVGDALNAYAANGALPPIEEGAKLIKTVAHALEASYIEGFMTSLKKLHRESM